jgi:hypothetical protein
VTIEIAIFLFRLSRVFLFSLTLGNTCHFSHDRSKWSPFFYRTTFSYVDVFLTLFPNCPHFSVIFGCTTDVELQQFHPQISVQFSGKKCFALLNAAVAMTIMNLISRVHLSLSCYRNNWNIPHTPISFWTNAVCSVDCTYRVRYSNSSFIKMNSIFSEIKREEGGISALFPWHDFRRGRTAEYWICHWRCRCTSSQTVSFSTEQATVRHWMTSGWETIASLCIFLGVYRGNYRIIDFDVKNAT